MPPRGAFSFRQQLVTFDGCCIIRADNGDTAYANETSIANIGSAMAPGPLVPTAAYEQRLLLHFANAQWLTTAGALLRVALTQAVEWDAASATSPVEGGFEWGFDIISEDFDFEGDDCATWNTKPTIGSAWGYGLVDVDCELAGTPAVLTWDEITHGMGYDDEPAYEGAAFGICVYVRTWYFGATSSGLLGAQSNITVDLDGSFIAVVGG